MHIQRMQAREYGLFCKELLELLTNDIMYCSDATLKCFSIAFLLKLKSILCTFRLL